MEKIKINNFIVTTNHFRIIKVIFITQKLLEIEKKLITHLKPALKK